MTSKYHRKILYQKGDYPDNYTNEHTFLCDLRKNVEFKEISTLEAVRGASYLTQQLCTVVVFVIVYIYLYNGWIEAQSLFYCSSLLTIIGYVIYKMLYSVQITENLGSDLRTALIFIVFGNLFSPVLYTLTDTISTDTIYTMTFLMMLIHLIFFDYGVSAAIVSKSLSLNAAIFASVCLASRLSSAYYAFVLISIAVKCFVLFPLLRSRMQKPLLMAAILAVTVVCMLATISAILTVLFVLLLIFINMVCPIMFVNYQKYKDNIYGPWDEAVVNDTDAVNDLIYS